MRARWRRVTCTRRLEVMTVTLKEQATLEAGP
jgi:hypothetical protein